MNKSPADFSRSGKKSTNPNTTTDEDTTMIATFRTLLTTLGFVAALSLPPTAQGMLMQLEGLITDAYPNPNPTFNLAVGDPVTGSITFDENLIISDPDAIISPLDGMTLSIAIGDAIFQETDDFGFPFAPLLTFTDGALTNIDVISFFDFDGSVIDPFGFTYSLDVLNGAFSIMDSGFGVIAGGVIGATAVSEPAILHLLLGGLLATLGWRLSSNRTRLPVA